MKYSSCLLVALLGCMFALPSSGRTGKGEKKEEEEIYTIDEERCDDLYNKTVRKWGKQQDECGDWMYAWQIKRCIKHYQDEKDWKTANNECISLGGELVVLEKKNSLDFLKCHGFIGEAWLGASKSNDKWLWANGTKVTQLEDWHVDVSSSETGCMTQEIRRSESYINKQVLAKLHERSCGDRHTFWCQRQIGATTPAPTTTTTTLATPAPTTPKDDGGGDDSTDSW